MQPKLLIFSPSPRDIPEFIAALKQINHDKLIVKYVHYADDPYNQALEFFLDHKEYSHFAICPDDLIVTRPGVEQLWKDAQEGHDYISAMCNRDMDNMDLLAMTFNIPAGNRVDREYQWYYTKDINPEKYPIIRVGWSGTPFCIMPRKVMEKISFPGDIEWNPGVESTESYDIQLGVNFHDMGLAEMVDTRVFFKHLRYGGEIQVGYKEPYMLFIQGKNITKLAVKSHY